MREIKFRAWDKENKTMLYDYFRVCPDGIVVDSNNQSLYGEVELMQYTGLKDKNGKEIYDGDIVHFNTLGGNNMYYEVKWSDAKTGFKPTRLTKTNQAEIEIIGNIYSDPHLLTDWRIRRSILIPNKNKSK